MADCAIGVVGLGIMGANLSRNLATSLRGAVAVYDLNESLVEQLVTSHPELNLEGFTNIAEFVGSLRTPRVILLMVPAGQPVDSAMQALGPHLAPGDIVIDGGNSHYLDTARRIERWNKADVHFVGMGTSGGEQGALLGPSLMVSAPPRVWDDLSPLLLPIAAEADDGVPCVALVGSGAAGHFTKMVHNGIEYADLELIGEIYSLLRATGASPSDAAGVFESWNVGDDRSYLLDATVHALSTEDSLGAGFLIDAVSDAATGKGTGAWTVASGAELGVSVSTVAAALFARSTSSAASEREQLAAPAHTTAPSIEVDPESLRAAYRAARLVAYQQGLSLLHAASAKYGWQVDLRAVVSTWRSGCIIRAGFLEKIRSVYTSTPGDALFLGKPPFSDELRASLPHLRRIVAAASLNGIPVPATAAALGEVEMLRGSRLPTALVQLLRDYFGSHGFERTDRPGKFHVQWSDDLCQTEM